MELNEILSKGDHTLLAQAATWEEIRAICDDGMKYHTASVCIPASYVKQAAEYAAGRLPICTVIGFPNGYSMPAVMAFEAVQAVADGADENDMPELSELRCVLNRRYGRTTQLSFFQRKAYLKEIEEAEQ